MIDGTIVSGLPRDLAFQHLNYYASGSCKEVGINQKNLVGALTDVIVNIHKFENRGSKKILRPTVFNIYTNPNEYFMPDVGEKMFQVHGGRGKLLSLDGPTTFLDGINFREDLVLVTHDEKIISVKGYQEWNLEYGLKCLVWDSNGSNTETSFSALFPQFFSKANLHIKKAYESADEDDLLQQDEWPFIFKTEGSPGLSSDVFHKLDLDIDYTELICKGVNDNPLVALLNERDQIRRLKSEGPSMTSLTLKIKGLGAQGYIRNLGTDFQDHSDHYDLEERVREILVLAFLDSSPQYQNKELGPLRDPTDRDSLDKAEPNQDD